MIGRKILLLSLILFLLIPSSVFAQQYAASQNVITLEKGYTTSGDYFAAGKTVIIDGTVNGDAYIGGGTVLMEGVIHGDLLTAGGQITVRGTVDGNVRAAGGQINITGSVGRNVSTAGGSVTIADNAKIGGSVANVGGQFSVFAPLSKSITLAGGQATIGNTINGNITAGVGQLTLTPDAQVSGDLTYMSANSAQIQPGAKIAGATTHNFPPKKQVNPNSIAKTFAAFYIWAKIASFLSALIIGVLMIAFLPVYSLSVSQTIRQRPWISLLIGIVTIFLTPLVIGILFLTLIGVPLALILLFSFILIVYLSKMFVSIWIGQLIFKKPQVKKQIYKPYLPFTVGLIIYEIVAIIPIIGWFVSLITLFLGTGAFVIQEKAYYSQLREKRIV